MPTTFATLIAGPTASGKSALALAEARAAGGLVVNADSMQVYADLAVLTARPTAEEAREVPHRLYGFVPADEEYSVGRYIADIAPLIAAARGGGAPLVIVGGTGLYFRALTAGLMPTPAIPDEIRRHWRAAASAGIDLHAELSRRDPARAAMLNRADRPRLLRAIELFEATGKPWSQWLAESPGEPLLGPGEWRGLFVDPPRDRLHAQIAARFEAMMARGALDEVARLVGRSPPPAANLGIMKAHGVPHLAGYLAGLLPLAEAIERSVTDTRAYARRQVIFARRHLAGPGWRWQAGVPG